MASALRNSSLSASFPKRVSVLETDGKCMILKAVQFDNGKYYNIRVWRRDAQGRDIQLNEQSGFSTYVLTQIQGLAIGIFDHYIEPSLTQIIYQKKGGEEECIARTPTENPPNTPLNTPEDKQIVDSARKIHELLVEPAKSFQWTNSNDPLVIYPKLVVPHPPAALKTPPQAKSAGPNMEEIDRAALAKRGPSLVLGKTTYAELEKYAMNPDAQNTQMTRIYEAFKNLLNDPRADGDAEKEVRKWIDDLYLEACRVYKENHRQQYEKETKRESFEAWCKQQAAILIVTRISIEIDPLPLVLDLIK